MKSRFQPDVDSSLRLPPSVRLIDPEAYDASEQRFAASIEEKPACPRFGFVVDVPQDAPNNPMAGDGSAQGEGDGRAGTQSTIGSGTETNLEAFVPAPSPQTELLVP